MTEMALYPYKQKFSCATKKYKYKNKKYYYYFNRLEIW